MTEDPPGSNSGTPVEDWIEELGFERPIPWCAVFASVKSRHGEVEEPRVWSARARDFAVADHSWKVADVLYGRYQPRSGDYRVKTRRGGNHVDIFLDWDPEKQQGYVIGGNVGDRVQVRLLTLQRMMLDGTTHVTEVHGRYRYDAPLPRPWREPEVSSEGGEKES